MGLDCAGDYDSLQTEAWLLGEVMSTIQTIDEVLVCEGCRFNTLHVGLQAVSSHPRGSMIKSKMTMIIYLAQQALTNLSLELEIKEMQRRL